MNTLKFGFGAYMWSTSVVKVLAAASVLAVVAACSLDKQKIPALTGPSELGLSLGITATPDIITQDGQSQATVQVLARDAAGQPKVDPVTLRADIYVGGVPVDFGVLSTKVVSTGTNGVAVFTYRAPAAPPPSVEADTVVTIVVTPVGTDYAGSVPRQVQIRLARPSVITPPSGGLNPAFTVNPGAPNIGDTVSFDASGATAEGRSIVNYAWRFGDGRAASGRFAQHIYDFPGVYVATLTITDDLGRTAESSRVVPVAAPLPTARIVFSPTDPVSGGQVFFTADVSTAQPAREIVFYEWNFGDGSPLVNGPDKRIVSHVYALEHTYAVTLKVRDDLGREHVVSTTVPVKSPEEE